MNNMKLLLVEDRKEDQKLCLNAIHDFNEENNLNIVLEIRENAEDAIAELQKLHYDGVIIDIKLTAAEPDGGNQVITQIKETFNRIPVAIMTGTPDAAEQEGFPLIQIYKKGGETGYLEIVEKFWSIYCTGLTRIMGGKGVIEDSLTTIFTRNLLPALTNGLSEQKSWIKYAQDDSDRTEKALLRYALNHLLQHLDNDLSQCYPEEMYIYPTLNNRINTGCILRKKDSEQYYIIMNPACDLAEREHGGCNTDRALLVEIQPITEIYPDINRNALSKNKGKELKNIYKNKKSLYYHWLPATDFYPGGVINFRHVFTYSEEEINASFERPIAQISAPFLKDMISRFSSYYARQGQPDIDIKFAGV